nr:reverse transcriptase domain-containing protein [Tanacetum cinerariifolium]
MANTTLIVTTVTKPTINPRDADATPRVNIQDFCEEYYEDIPPIIMDKVRRDNRKEVHARLDFGEGSKERRTREGSHYSSARTLSARPERLKVRERLRYNDRHKPPHKRDTSNGDRPESKECFRNVGESYDNSHYSYGTGINHGYRYHDRDRSRHMKRRRDSESSLSNSIDSYKDLKAAFLAYFMQQKKYIKDLVEIHNIKQKDGETIEDFMERFKVETRRMKGAPNVCGSLDSCMGFDSLD